MTLQEQIHKVAVARQKAHDLSKMKKDSYLRWMAAEGELIDAETEAAQECAQAEETLREMTLAEYERTKDKHPAPGVGIKVGTRLDYNEHDAFAWAVVHEMALSLNRKSFEAHAKISQLDFVTITEEATATIATDLGKLLGGNLYRIEGATE